MDQDHPRVTIVGGGISGLAAAYRLTRYLDGRLITLVEANSRLGGKISTEHIGEFIIESGPDSFLAAKPRGIGLAAEVGLRDDLIAVTPRGHRAYVLWRNRLHELPEGLTGLVPTRLGPLARSSLLSPIGKARAAADYLIPARELSEDEPLGGFIRRRLGAEAWERLVEPLMAGIYAADGDALSLMATFPQLRLAEQTHGSLIRGVLANRKHSATDQAPKPAFLTPKLGLSQLVEALTERLSLAGVTILTDAPVVSITGSPGAFELELERGPTISTAAVILAVPAFIAGDLVSGLDSALANELRAIPYSSTAIVTFAFRGDHLRHPLDAHGYVVPRAMGGPILACTWSSRKWRHRAPQGWELIRVFLGRTGQDDILAADDHALVRVARDELGTRLGIGAPPDLLRVQRWPRGMPQYLLGHRERVKRIEELAGTVPGLFLASNALYGVGIPDAIASGEKAADAVGLSYQESSRRSSRAVSADR